VTGNPGCGKTSLAYAIAWELDLGPVLRWSISPRTQLVEDGLYQYDAISRLQDSQIPRELKESGGDGKVFGSPVADYIKLGPVGTAFLPYGRPRVLLVDEIDKSDIQLPNELLSLFDEGLYEIPPLQREARRFAEGSPESAKQSAMKSVKQKVRTADPEVTADIYDGVVQCLEFPIVVMTSNRERDFPAAFNRRCIRIEMPRPTEEDTLKDLVLSHFRERKPAIPLKDEDQVPQEIRKFLNHPDQADLATDQLLNALYLLTLQDWQSPTEKEIEELRTILYRGLHARDGAD
jgi:MoxR-like ATPase